jgi:predicted small metal-binding protein
MSATAAPIKAIRCPCGFEVRGRSEAELVQMARIHVEKTHGELISDEQARALIQPI